MLSSIIQALSMNYTAILFVFLAFNLFWTVIVSLTIYLTRFGKLTQSARKHIIFRGVKVIHGSMAFIFCAAAFAYMLVSVNEPPIDITQTIMLLSASYYFFDLVFALWMRMSYPSLVFHHIISVIQIVGWLYQPAYYFFSSMALIEMSVGPMNFREILRHLGMRFTKMFSLTEQVFFYSMLVGRGVLFVPVAVVPMYMNPDFPLYMKINTGIVVLLCYYYCSQIWRKLKSRVKQNREMLEKGVEFGWFKTDMGTLKHLSFGESKEERQI